MNCLQKFGCRLYQGVMYVASQVLPWREPELLEFENGVEGLPAFIKSKGITNVLVVTDSMLKKLGLIDGMVAQLDEQGIKYSVYSDVVPNPPIENIEAGVEIYKRDGCEAIIAFGGGSPMDCAKGIGARIARPNKQIPQMKGVLKVRKKLPTIFAIPTTAGTGSETTLAAVISNSKTHEKYAINDHSLIPPYAVLDPKLTVGLPKHITSTTGIDALTHAVEAYIGKGNVKSTREAAVKAVKLIFGNLQKAYDNGADLEARANMQKGSYYAGVAFTRAYVGYVHAIAHTLGGFYNVPHGLANSVVLPYVLEYYGDSITKQLYELSLYVGIADMSKSKEENAKAFIQAIKDMEKAMDIPTTIKGIKEEDIPTMVERAYKEANPLYPVPKFMGKEELTAIYHKIMAKEENNEA